ncbi:hypothetical protein FA10DRAFT_302487 [Acaromyces ingoldii]|uniref:WIBG Mago-binding domain-containing protein n=1 Tax=Acaromyces ingoldii TaxID=215250 RepID=A0A316YHT1_9BASI|nr:hypothetical protein FA10DRAFT_302487 [Acaromyces ingoldii]PWN89110.1 hypothetical protein FA10DRAFT_302487 [Acaromyces ingoldii]
MSTQPATSASGIVSDGSTRLIPESRRADGSVRKERKVKPGFTPAEDIGKFRSARVEARKAGASEQVVGAGQRATSESAPAPAPAPARPSWRSGESPRKGRAAPTGASAPSLLEDTAASFPALPTSAATTRASREELDEAGRWKKTPMESEVNPKKKSDESSWWRGGGTSASKRQGDAPKVNGKEGKAQGKAVEGDVPDEWDGKGEAKEGREGEKDELSEQLDKLGIK